MLKKKLGINAIENDWGWNRELTRCFKIPSSLVIPVGCVRVGMSAFYGCWRLREVVIPKSVEWIGDDAFWACRKAEVILKKHEKDFKHIGIDAFKFCKDVKEEVRD